MNIRFSLLILLLGACATAQEKAVQVSELKWPRMYEDQGDRLVVYDPQVDSWGKHAKIAARSAIVVTPKGSTENLYGVIEYTVDSEVHVDSRSVLLKNRQVKALRFPGVPDAKAKPAAAIAERILEARKSIQIPLDLVLAYQQTQAERVPSVNVNLNPPPIHASEEPAILVMFMGEPVFKPVAGTTLRFAVNTNWDLFQDASTYYLLNGKAWITTPDLRKGPWKTAEALPADFWRLPKEKDWDDVRAQLPGEKLPAPKVIVTTEPSELILTEGVPRLAAIPGLPLVYVSNTASHLFRHTAEGKWYFLTSGRWFRADTLQGPWNSASGGLPPEFAKIPPEHEKADVRASVPGTPEAADAVLLAQVPRKATVERKSLTVTVTYDGAAKFVAIDGTKVQYAENSPLDVFLVAGRYYCCHNAVWFVADAATGPWVVCDTVPAEIYAIPSTHPKHNVTYVYVYESSPTVVVVGCTAGYSGCYVAGGVVVFGACWAIAWSHAWCHYHYHAHYYGWGFGAHYSWHHGGWYSSAHVHGPYGGAGWGAGYNPHTGTYVRGAYASGPHGSRYFAESYNPYTGTYKARADGSTPYAQWERGVAVNGDGWVRGGYYTDSRGTVFRAEGSEGGKIAGGKRDDGEGVVVAKDRDGDLYVGHDGNVYRRDEGSWQERGDGAWGTKPATRDLERDAQSRARLAEHRAAHPVARPRRPTIAETCRGSVGFAVAPAARV